MYSNIFIGKVSVKMINDYFYFSKIIIMDIPRNYHLEDKVEYIIALVNEERMIV